jgi:hypothetical protein
MQAQGVMDEKMMYRVREMKSDENDGNARKESKGAHVGSADGTLLHPGTL